MSKKNKYQYNYKSLLLEGETVNLFRKFCKYLKRKQSSVLHEMIHFFQWHGISPFDRFGPQLQREGAKTRKRIDAVIAIIKDIEKNQTKPTTAMLQALFAGLDPLPQNDTTKSETNNNKAVPDDAVPKIKYNRLKEERDDYRRDLLKILDHITTVKPTFGSEYLKLDMPEAELIKIERTLNK